MEVEFGWPLIHQAIPEDTPSEVALDVISDSESQYPMPRKGTKPQNTDKGKHKSRRHVSSSPEDSDLPSHPKKPSPSSVVVLNP